MIIKNSDGNIIFIIDTSKVNKNSPRLELSDEKLISFGFTKKIKK